jgi:hypothetical protein
VLSVQLGQQNNGVLDRDCLKLVLKAAAHLKPSDDELLALIKEIQTVDLPHPFLNYAQLQVSDSQLFDCDASNRFEQSLLSSGRFSPYEEGRTFVCISLAEAETIRRIMHMRLGMRAIEFADTALALRCIPAGNVITDRTIGLCG